MSALGIRMLGAFDAAPLHEPLTRKGSWLLALLVLRHDRTTQRRWLAGTLWPETSEELALYNLRRELSRVRRALGPHGDRLESPRPGVLALRVDGASVDVVELDRILADPEADADALERAVALHRGPLLEGCGEAWVIEEREARAGAYLAALERLAARAMAAGDSAAAIRWLRLAVATDPLRESTQRSLIHALAASGAYAAATQTYRELRLALRRELQVDPAPETRALHERVLGETRARAAPRVRGARGAPLRALTRWVGRTDEIRDVAARLVSSRLVTLVGAGGLGKSRLALEVVNVMVRELDVDAVFVELSALGEPALVASTVATAVGLRDPSPRPSLDALSELLRDQRLLLVLDNCEHLVEACATIVARLLATCPDVRILATSREPFRIVGELAWCVPSLIEEDAVQLFVERAEEVQPTVSLAGSLDTVALICARLDGIPLAIELAAARTKVLSVGDIAARLDDRFQLLTGGSRVGLPRHQTLRATMDWSYELLVEEERTLLERLSVFAGGFTLQAAEHVCGGPVLDTLASLVDKSLVSFDGRYGMLETVRQYASERLVASGAHERARDAHLACFCALAEETAPAIFGGGHDGERIELLQLEHDNLRASFEWAKTRGDASTAMRLVGALHWFWFAKAHLAEGRTWVCAALARSERVPSEIRARALTASGLVAMWTGDFGAMRAPLGEALEIAERMDDRFLESYAGSALGAAWLFGGDPARARPLVERSAELAREIGDAGLRVFAEYWLATACEALGDVDASRAALEEAIACARDAPNQPGLAHALYRRGHCAHAEGKHREATESYVESLSVFRRTGEQYGISMALDALGLVAIVEGDGRRGAALLGAAEAVRRRIGAELLPSERAVHERAVAAARRSVGEVELAAAWREGAALPPEEAIALALIVPGAVAADR